MHIHSVSMNRSKEEQILGIKKSSWWKRPALERPVYCFRFAETG